MREEWLDDILAILDTGSLSKAAEMRFVTQSAFSRRIHATEQLLNTELVDRSKKPVTLHPSILDNEQRIRELVTLRRELVYALQNQNLKNGHQIVFASPHSLTTEFAPHLVRFLSSKVEFVARLKSANRDECTVLLLTKAAQFILTYRANFEDPRMLREDIEELRIGQERLIPVCAAPYVSAFRQDFQVGEVSIITYPSNVFLGEVVSREILPKVNSSVILNKRAETGLTHAALQLALQGIAIAWVPLSLARDDIIADRLVDLRQLLPETSFSIVVQRMTGRKSPYEIAIWNSIKELLRDHAGECPIFRL